MPTDSVAFHTEDGSDLGTVMNTRLDRSRRQQTRANLWALASWQVWADDGVAEQQQSASPSDVPALDSETSGSKRVRALDLTGLLLPLIGLAVGWRANVW